MQKNAWDRCTSKISDLGSNVCGTVLNWSVFFDLISLKSMQGIMPVSFFGGHSIWMNVRCYFTSCKETCGKKNLICMTGVVWLQPDMDSIAPLIFFLIFSSVNFCRAQRKDAVKWMFSEILTSALSLNRWNGLFTSLIKMSPNNLKDTPPSPNTESGLMSHMMSQFVTIWKK